MLIIKATFSSSILPDDAEYLAKKAFFVSVFSPTSL